MNTCKLQPADMPPVFAAPRLVRSFASAMRWLYAIGITAAFALPSGVMAQTSTAKPVHLIVPYPAGFSNDLVGRLVASRLSAAMAQPYIVENREGAEGQIGSIAVAKAPPDGQTLLLGANGPIIMRPIIFPDLGYKTSDFTPIALLGKSYYIAVVAPNVKASNVQEFLSLVRSQPGKLNYASVGTAGAPYLCVQALKLKYGLDMVHIPYKSAPAVLTDMAAGRVHFFCASLAGIVPFVKSGKLKALASATLQRSHLMPELPTFNEQGVENFEAGSWTGVLGPLRMPPALVRRLSDELLKIMAVPSTQAEFLARGVEGEVLSAEAFAAYIKAEIPKWTEVVKAAGITGED